MFRTLLSDIRIGVISRMFLFQPRRPGAQAADRLASESAAPVPLPQKASTPQTTKKKRKRH